MCAVWSTAFFAFFLRKHTSIEHTQKAKVNTPPKNKVPDSYCKPFSICDKSRSPYFFSLNRCRCDQSKLDDDFIVRSLRSDNPPRMMQLWLITISKKMSRCEQGRSGVIILNLFYFARAFLFLIYFSV